LAYHVGQVAFFTMIAGCMAALVGLRINQKRRYSGVTLASFLPPLLINALRMGCNYVCGASKAFTALLNI
jgi:uncharacterized membrane protein